jgi:hypothetical protein
MADTIVFRFHQGRFLNSFFDERVKKKFEARVKKNEDRSQSQIMASALVKIDIISLNSLNEETSI